ncbi:hypothetical protein [Fulvivirga lutea]|uniref:Uncharacterized protein n=1 Tax=Fulvivirga lutea TaxID=2810512 RepID=A0A974WKK0_9BACT|nr:hypothetical protein [Fulvivirga lutea]QSE97068.1 hypothetical protein JR347_15960 [Fulvivirga lutea]
MKATYTTDYFSTEFKIIIGITILVGGFFIVHLGYNPIWHVFLALLLGVIASTKYELSVDSNAKTIIDATKVLGLYLKKREFNYNLLKAISLEKENERYTANTRSRSRQVEFNMYTASIITDKEEVEIFTSSNYKSFSEKLKQFANELNLDIQRSF